MSFAVNFIIFKVELCSEGRQISFKRVLSPQNVSFPLNIVILRLW